MVKSSHNSPDTSVSSETVLSNFIGLLLNSTFPFFKLPELRSFLKKSLPYLKKHHKELVETGYASKQFSTSAWLDTFVRFNYPLDEKRQNNSSATNLNNIVLKFSFKPTEFSNLIKEMPARRSDVHLFKMSVIKVTIEHLSNKRFNPENYLGSICKVLKIHFGNTDIEWLIDLDSAIQRHDLLIKNQNLEGAHKNKLSDLYFCGGFTDTLLFVRHILKEKAYGVFDGTVSLIEKDDPKIFNNNYPPRLSMFRFPLSENHNRTLTNARQHYNKTAKAAFKYDSVFKSTMEIFVRENLNRRATLTALVKPVDYEPFIERMNLHKNGTLVDINLNRINPIFKPVDKPIIIFSKDNRQITCQDQPFTVSVRQCAVIRFMYNQSLKGKVLIASSEIIKQLKDKNYIDLTTWGENRRLQDIFKSSTMHPLWKTLIVPVSSKSKSYFKLAIFKSE